MNDKWGRTRSRARIMLAALALACGGEKTTAPRGSVASLSLTPAKATLGVGSSAALEAIAVSIEGDTLSPAAVQWSSSDPTKVRVSASGVLTAVAVGSARIAATMQGQSATSTVTVVPTAVASIELSPLDVRLTEGARQTVTARLYDAAGATLSGRTVQWRSSDAAVASVSSTGVVTAVGQGIATIVATSEGRNASVSVSVSAVAVASVKIVPAGATVAVGANRQLAAEVRDAKGALLTGRAVVWSTTTPSVVSVSATGLVVGVAAGTGKVVASAGGKSVAATVTVEALPAPVVVGRVTLSPSAATLQTSGGSDRTVGLEAVAYRRDGNDWVVIPGARFTYASTNADVASVSADGVVTALAAGRTTIVATSGSQFATAEIIVEAPVAPIVIERVTVTPTTATIKSGGKDRRTVQLTAEAFRKVGNEWKPVPGALFTWVSSNPFVALVTPTGLVTGLSRGTVTITATSAGVSATARITVERK